MIISIDRQSPGRRVYRALSLPGRPQQPTTVQELLTPVHPHRYAPSLRAGIHGSSLLIAYFQSVVSGRSGRDGWKFYRNAMVFERRLIVSLLARNVIVFVDTSSDILLLQEVAGIQSAIQGEATEWTRELKS